MGRNELDIPVTGVADVAELGRIVNDRLRRLQDELYRAVSGIGGTATPEGPIVPTPTPTSTPIEQQAVLVVRGLMGVGLAVFPLVSFGKYVNLTGYEMRAQTAPTGGSVTFQVRASGAVLATIILLSGQTFTRGTLAVQVAQYALVTVDCVDAPFSTPGSNYTLMLRYEQTPL